ncbi:glycosyl hydrolase [Neolewinella litorea]|uniref:GH26 domain-containing protein n=1 Tax=Neolewinella litorea TaxID=2562452 RepID=A0A4S4NY41_9BACT|nr:glycosyl hydrolase [Neolewinella litorea]THH41170.1 hypothetical protein E4021_00810 [Neolewinella litorea]
MLAIAAVGILLYLLAPTFGWMLDSIFQRSTALYPAPEVEVIGRYVLDESPEAEIPPRFTHYILDLNYQSGWLEDEALLEALRDERPVMITVQTWSSGSRAYDNNPLVDVNAGRYDDIFTRFFRLLPEKGEGIYLRFNPEMEVPVDQYPWQQYPSVYIDAYRRFARLSAQEAPAAVRMWSPAGYPGALEFYPGDDVVDAASVTYRYSGEGQLTAYPRDLPPDTDLYRRLHRLRFLSVPIYVILPPEAKGALPDLNRVIQKLRQAPEGTYGKQPSLDAVTANRKRYREEAFTFGLYDPDGRLLDNESISAEHLFTDFQSIDSGKFDSLFRAVDARGHVAIVSFEPFHAPDEVRDSNVLETMVEGKYDSILERLYTTLGSASGPVYFRYAHEMEIPIHRYPWQSQDPHTYIRSFRYVMNPDRLPANIRRVWGPAGDRGSLEWYPGDDFVDYISIAIYGLPDKNITDPKQQEQFATVFNRKMWRMRFVGKPVFITEFGVKGPEDYQTDWMLGAAKTLRDDYRIVGINYFNMSDTPKAWGDIKPPDWSITRPTLDAFVAALTGERKERQ